MPFSKVEVDAEGEMDKDEYIRYLEDVICRGNIMDLMHAQIQILKNQGGRSMKKALAFLKNVKGELPDNSEMKGGK